MSIATNEETFSPEGYDSDAVLGADDPISEWHPQPNLTDTTVSQIVEGA